MIYIRVILFVIPLLVLLAGVISFPTDTEAEVIYEKQLEIRSGFECKTPQPRVVYLHEIVGDVIWKNLYINMSDRVRPFGVVLHRCENSGCCRRYNERCTASNEQTVNLIFKVSNKGHTSFKYEEVKAINHTSCSCQKIGINEIK